MRAPIGLFFLFAGLISPLVASLGPSPFELTVVLDFKGTYSPAAIQAMQTEAGRILDSSGVRLHWSIAGGESVKTDLVVMTLKGACGFSASPDKHEVTGPYGMTYVVDGRITPFAEVNCDRVVGSARGAMPKDAYPRGDQVIGRAIGRVVAHELVHMLTGSCRHGSEGVERPALAGEDLVADSLPLSLLDNYRVKQEIRSHCAI